MKYFLHDSNAFNDEKITELFINFGYEGLGLFYTLLEKLAQQEKPVKTNVLKSQLKVGKKLEKCWLFMESIELISSNNGETFNKQLMNFSGKYAIKKEKNKKRISEWRDKQLVTENVTHYESVRNTHKVKESKVNKSKENKINISCFSFLDFWAVYPNKTSKADAEKRYNKLSETDREIIKKTINNFIENKPFKDYNHPMASTYINQKRWLDEVPEKIQSYDFGKISASNGVIKF